MYLIRTLYLQTCFPHPTYAMKLQIFLLVLVSVAQVKNKDYNSFPICHIFKSCGPIIPSWMGTRCSGLGVRWSLVQFVFTFGVLVLTPYELYLLSGLVVILWYFLHVVKWIKSGFEPEIAKKVWLLSRWWPFFCLRFQQHFSCEHGLEF